MNGINSMYDHRIINIFGNLNYWRTKFGDDELALLLNISADKIQDIVFGITVPCFSEASMAYLQLDQPRPTNPRVLQWIESGARIRVARLKLGMTQTELANKSGMSSSVVSEAEKGRGSFASLTKLREVLGIDEHCAVTDIQEHNFNLWKSALTANELALIIGTDPDMLDAIDVNKISHVVVSRLRLNTVMQDKAIPENVVDGIKLAARRLEVGLSRRQLARLCGLNYAQVALIEQGRGQERYLEKVRKVLYG